MADGLYRRTGARIGSATDGSDGAMVGITIADTGAERPYNREG